MQAEAVSWWPSRLDSFEEWFAPVPESGCWLWLGALNWAGYGHFYFRGKLQGAHRVSWLLHNGVITAGLEVCHKCDIPSCVNPSHLFLGTHQENLHDAAKKGKFKAHNKLRGVAFDLRVKGLRAGGYTYREIASLLGVSISTVHLSLKDSTDYVWYGRCACS